MKPISYYLFYPLYLLVLSAEVVYVITERLDNVIDQAKENLRNEAKTNGK